MLKNIKVYVGKYSREIQEKAFALGWGWKRGDKNEIKHFSAPFLFFNENKEITWGTNMEGFLQDSDHQEITAEEILAMEVPIDKTIPIGTSGWYNKINGDIIHKDYNKGEAFQLFSNIEEAEAYAILPTLLYWRDKYNEGWKPDWKLYDNSKYIIWCHNEVVEKTATCVTRHMFAFKTAKIRDKFFEDFREELEIVKPLL